jgi:hypothetical protein
MKATKTAVNYTPAQIDAMTAAYVGKDNKAEVAKIAADLGKSPASVRAKLSQLGVYKTAEKASASVSTTNKLAIATEIAKEAALTEAEIEGLAKSTKSALEKVLAALTNR